MVCVISDTLCQEADIFTERMKICWPALQKNYTNGKIDLETHYPSILLVQDGYGRYIQPCMVPYILANAFVNVQFTVEAHVK